MGIDLIPGCRVVDRLSRMVTTNSSTKNSTTDSPTLACLIASYIVKRIHRIPPHPRHPHLSKYELPIIGTIPSELIFRPLPLRLGHNGGTQDVSRPP